ncbi:Trehalase [Termitomyces sp. J132]|nr:Trehalase [Termitomyces sp. J132]
MFSLLTSFACVGLTAALTSVSNVSVATATPSLSVSSVDALPTQAALPPKQIWCPSEIFCAGQLLQTVNIAQLYPDDKTFVDKPTNKPAPEVLADFQNISSSTTYGEVVQFVENDFKGEGLELEALELANFKSDPAFLNNVSAPIVKAFAKTVHGFWTQLIRGTNASTLCTGGSTGCESSLIPLNHTFVVPGGRFREQYYWDSFWIVEGLIESELHDIVNATIQNFMDELDAFGFIPNGGRIYYLDRSQPPLFIQMLSRYVTASGDRTILRRALPLAEKEFKWWNDNRSLQVQSASNVTHKVYRYSVNNSAPRPESYLADYTTASVPNTLNDTQKAALYAELASGAETGWDYTVRWFAPTAVDNNDGLRSLNVRNTIPIDLNSILYKNHILLANLYENDDNDAASSHRKAAAALRAAILDLFWDPIKLAFYDYNLATNSRNSVYSVANFYPLWSGIIPSELLNSSDKAFSYFSSLNLVLNRYNGTFPSTFIVSGQQWDAPNTWPPHQYIVLQALHINRLNGTVLNGGNATDGEGWGKALERQLANRYITSAFCSWRATGGSIEGLVPRLSLQELNATQSVNNTGNMFEKFSNLDVDSAGRGGEYTVQAGFGWTNGVVLWVSSFYGGVLVEPECPSLITMPTTSNNGQNGAVRLTGNGSSVTLRAMLTFVFVGLFVHGLGL